MCKGTVQLARLAASLLLLQGLWATRSWGTRHCGACPDLITSCTWRQLHRCALNGCRSEDGWVSLQCREKSCVECGWNIDIVDSHWYVVKLVNRFWWAYTWQNQSVAIDWLIMLVRICSSICIRQWAECIGRLVMPWSELWRYFQGYLLLPVRVSLDLIFTFELSVFSGKWSIIGHFDRKEPLSPVCSEFVYSWRRSLWSNSLRMIDWLIPAVYIWASKLISFLLHIRTCQWASTTMYLYSHCLP